MSSTHLATRTGAVTRRKAAHHRAIIFTTGIPDDVMIDVICFLSSVDVIQVMLISRNFRTLATTPRVWTLQVDTSFYCCEYHAYCTDMWLERKPTRRKENAQKMFLYLITKWCDSCDAIMDLCGNPDCDNACCYCEGDYCGDCLPHVCEGCGGIH
jgi:hypothetical protein